MPPRLVNVTVLRVVELPEVTTRPMYVLVAMLRVRLPNSVQFAPSLDW
jgi:hypothetical protein